MCAPMSDPHAAPQEEEPQSPSWLPALGLAIFATLAIAWSLCSGGSPSPAAAGAEAASAVGNPAH
jgi:hypothetical protein